jgi:toxin ParE1/3/4
VKPVIIHSEARAELDQEIGRYENIREGLGLSLQDEVELATSRIQENPKLGAPYKKSEFRFTLVRRFPFVIYYCEFEESLWIAAIAHERRRPSYWMKRRPE